MYKNYNTSELELDITTYSLKLPSDHIAFLISHFVDSISLNILSEEASHTGRPFSSGYATKNDAFCLP